MSVVVILAACAFVLTVSSVRTPAQDKPEEGPNLEADPDSANERQPIDKDVAIANSIPKLGARLAVIENNVALAWAAHYSGQADQAKNKFTSAMSSLLAIRKELIELEGINPMVRMVNLETGRYATNDRPETYRQFTTYMNAWISQMPDGLQAEMDKRFGSEARAWLKSAEASQDAASLRDLADTHFFTEAGMRALDLLVALGVEQGNSLEVASWLLRLREMRPAIWKTSPSHMLHLLMALSALGDDELLEPMLREAETLHSGSKVLVGTIELPMIQAFERVRRTPEQKKSASVSNFTGLAKMEVLPLASRTESGAFAVDNSGQDNSNNWRWNPWGYYSQVVPTEYHVEPLVSSHGVIAPRLLSGVSSGESWYVWFPESTTANWRSLMMSEVQRYQRPVQNPTNNRYWRSPVSESQYSYQRVFGVGEGVFQSPPTAAHPDGRMVRCFVGCMNSGRSTNGLLTGNQIHIFDADRQGSLIMSLPLDSQVALGQEIAEEAPKREPAPEPEAPTMQKKLSATELGTLLGRTHFCGVPVIEDGCLYVGGSISNRSTTEYRVFCFDLNGQRSGVPGSLLWQTNVSSVKGTMDYWSSRSIVRESGSLLKSGNLLLVTTNHGSVACVDARDGATAWIVGYRLRDGRERDEGLFTRNTEVIRPILRPQRPYLTGTTLISAPSDGVSGVYLDVCSGSVFGTLLNHEREYEASNYFIGIAGGRGFFQTSDGVTSVPVTHSALVSDGQKSWVHGKRTQLTGAPPEFTSDYKPDVRGLLMTTDEHQGMLLLAGSDRLYRFRASDLTYIDSFPWPTDPTLEPTTPKPVSTKPTTTPNETAPKPTNANRFRLPGCLMLQPSNDGGPSRLLHCDPFAIRSIELK